MLSLVQLSCAQTLLIQGTADSMYVTGNTPGYTAHYKCVYKCVYSYELVSEAYSECLYNGYWRGEEPACECEFKNKRKKDRDCSIELYRYRPRTMLMSLFYLLYRHHMPRPS